MNARRRHRRRRVLEPYQVSAVGSGDILGQHGLEQAERLAELHGSTFELTQHPEQLFRSSLLELLTDFFGWCPAQPFAEPDRGSAGKAEWQ